MKKGMRRKIIRITDLWLLLSHLWQLPTPWIKALYPWYFSKGPDCSSRCGWKPHVFMCLYLTKQVLEEHLFKLKWSPSSKLIKQWWHVLQSDLCYVTCNAVSLSPVYMYFPAQLWASSGKKLPSSLKVPPVSHQPGHTADTREGTVALPDMR